MSFYESFKMIKLLQEYFCLKITYVGGKEVWWKALSHLDDGCEISTYRISYRGGSKSANYGSVNIERKPSI